MCVCVYMYICMCVCVYICSNTEIRELKGYLANSMYLYDFKFESKS